jgi:mannosyl-oligosaccharide glucosidase
MVFKMHWSSQLLIALTAVEWLPVATASSSTEGASILVNEVAKANNQSLLWGPYKPNLYFGVQPRIPKSFAGGLLWAKVDDYATAQSS